MSNNKSVVDLMLSDANNAVFSSPTPPDLSVTETPEYAQAIESPPRTPTEQITRNLGRGAKVVSSAALGTVGNTQNMLENLLTLPAGMTPEQVRGMIEERGLSAPGHFPTSQELKEGIEKEHPSLKPENQDERKQEEGLEFFTNLAGPGAGRGIVNNLVRAGIGAYGGMKLAQELDKMGVGPGWQETAKLLVGIGSQLGKKSVKLDPSVLKREQRIIYEAGQRAGLTDEQITPLIQSEQKLRFLGKMTSETAKNKAAIEGAEKGTSSFLNSLIEKGKNIVVPQTENKYLIDSLNHLDSSISQGLGKAPGLQTVKKYIKSIRKELESGNPIKANRLIQTFRDINREFSENSPSMMNYLQTFNRRLTRSLMRADKELGRDFRLGNKLFESRIDFIKKVGWKNVQHSMTNGTPAQNLLGTVVGGVAGSVLGKGKLGAAVGATVGAMSTFGTNWIANRLLTDPGWQGIRQATTNAFLKDSPKLAYSVVQSIKERVKKENPEAYRNIEWPES